MSSTSPRTPPSTIDGLKKLAKAYKHAIGIPHHEALNRAAVASGFNNFRDAKRRLPAATHDSSLGQPSTYIAIVSAYWKSDGDGEGEGLEVLRLSLSKPLDLILTARELRFVSTLAPSKLAASDHIEARYDFPDRRSARLWALTAARTLRFMAETELRPALQAAQRDAIRLDSLPGRDHVSYWVHGRSGEVFAVDEPYDYDEAIRTQWAQERGFHIVRPNWLGLHNPRPRASSFIVARTYSGSELIAIAIERAESLGPIDGSGDSFAYKHRFASPAEIALQRPLRRREMPAKPGTIRAGAVAYGGLPGQRGRWRPAVAMPLDLHKQAGILVQRILASRIPYRAEKALDVARYELDSWFYGEYGAKLEEEHKPYYSANAHHLESVDIAESLKALVATLQFGYDDCAPVRNMVSRLKGIAAKLG